MLEAAGKRQREHASARAPTRARSRRPWPARARGRSRGRARCPRPARAVARGRSARTRAPACSAAIPGPSSSTTRAPARRPGSSARGRAYPAACAAARSRRGCGRSGARAARRRGRRRCRRPPARAGGRLPCARAELLASDSATRARSSGSRSTRSRPGIEPGEVEQLGGELRQAVDLLAHPAEELAPGLLVELLVDEQLEEAAEREERRPQLVRRVRDELAAGVLEPGEPLTHPVERARELAELVRARSTTARRTCRPRSAPPRARAAGCAARRGARRRSRAASAAASAISAEISSRCLTRATLASASSSELETSTTWPRDRRRLRRLRVLLPAARDGSARRRPGVRGSGLGDRDPSSMSADGPPLESAKTS